ncbi:HNT3 Aprataxin-like protein [Candida maltosa Xu316]|uniref:Aprataxin C2HE/C2H2/C2HC zinc finger domain-containing protein n=1 Tax=Candida maltosa (strain Xu316) TaxID=1245528 RepID=M3HMJ0_CANMX|nr:hypothetical protein G210_0750 [Candida maltosa Xu316]
MSFRDAFQKYINNPEKYDIVDYHDENVIIIKDMFPKATRHLLVIPRNPQLTKTHPLDAFNKNYKEYTGEELYDMVSDYVEKAKDMIADELLKYSELQSKEQLQEFRNTFIQAGVHSIPSLNNLHVHVITQDFHSSRLKNKKHYNSFTTKFFVPFDELNPLHNEKYMMLNKKGEEYDSDSDNSELSIATPSFIKHERSKEKLEAIIKNTPFKCTSCSKTFGNSMVKLKEHLAMEYTKKYEKLIDPSVLEPNGFNLDKLPETK